MLSFYYLLVIRYNWKESQIRAKRKWFHLPPMIGVVLAFVSIPFIGVGFVICQTIPPPLADSYWPISVVQTFPIGFNLLVATVNTLLVYATVRAQEIRALQWRFPNTSPSTVATNSGSQTAAAAAMASAGTISRASSVDRDDEDDMFSATAETAAATTTTASTSRSRRGSLFGSLGRNSSAATTASNETNAASRMRTATFWQSLCYLGAFYLSWLNLVIINVGFANGEGVRIPYSVWATWAIVSPLQGFTNCMVYLRPRMVARRRKRRLERQRQRRRNHQQQQLPEAPVGGDKNNSEALEAKPESSTMQQSAKSSILRSKTSSKVLVDSEYDREVSVMDQDPNEDQDPEYTLGSPPRVTPESGQPASSPENDDL